MLGGVGREASHLHALPVDPRKGTNTSIAGFLSVSFLVKPFSFLLPERRFQSGVKSITPRLSKGLDFILFPSIINGFDVYISML